MFTQTELPFDSPTSTLSFSFRGLTENESSILIGYSNGILMFFLIESDSRTAFAYWKSAREAAKLRDDLMFYFLKEDLGH
jgi:hypothetical protein